MRLGINLDHVATLRNARGEPYPDPVQMAAFAQLGGADNITCHLREDRRHIRDDDVRSLRETIDVPLNFEMAATAEMTALALDVRPHAVTLVPEKREELTTEGGLHLEACASYLEPIIGELKEAGILVSLFVEPDEQVVQVAKQLGAGALEFHTGGFCHKLGKAHSTAEQYECLRPLVQASLTAHACGLQSHAGHGLHYHNAAWMQHVPHLEEVNIGHAVIARALFVGMEQAVRDMKSLVTDPRLCPKVPSLG